MSRFRLSPRGSGPCLGRLVVPGHLVERPQARLSKVTLLVTQSGLGRRDPCVYGWARERGEKTTGALPLVLIYLAAHLAANG